MKYSLTIPVLFFAVACRVPGGDQRTELDLEVPDAWHGPLAGEEPIDPRWWSAFGSDELSAFVDEAQHRNRDLAVAAARVSRLVPPSQRQSPRPASSRHLLPAV